MYLLYEELKMREELLCGRSDPSDNVYEYRRHSRCKVPIIEV